MVLFIIILPVFAIILSLLVGRFDIFRTGIIGFFCGHDLTALNLFRSIRLPRAIASFMVGGILSMSGLVLQGIFKNPLVSPDIIGISSGATLFTTMAIVFFTAPLFLLQLSSFVGGIIAVGVVFYLWRVTKSNNITNVVISGMLVNSLAQAGITFLKYKADPLRKLPALEYWLMGSFNKITKSEALFILPVGIGTLVILYLFRWQINILSVGDEDARYLGVDVNKVRLIIIVLVTLSVSSAVSISGNIGWIGLVAPHIIRMIFKNQSEDFVFLSFFLGGTLMTLSDTIARSILPSEVPISVITALIGAPILGYHLIKMGDDQWQ